MLNSIERGNSGTNDNADQEELILQDIDDQTEATPAKKSTTSEMTVGESTRRTKLKTACLVVQRVIFLVVWLLIVIITLSHEFTDDDPEGFIGVTPDKPEYFHLKNFDGENQLGVTLEGPFNLETQKTAPASAKYMTVTVVYSKNEGAEEQVLSDEWKLLIAEPVDTSERNPTERVFNLEQSPPDNMFVYLRFESTAAEVLTIYSKVQTKPMNKNNGVIIGAFILLFLYSLIVFEIIDRTFAAMLASSLSLAALHVLGTFPTIQELVHWIDIETILLLFGMMILVGILSESGLFDYMTVFAYQITKGRVWPLINTLCFFTALCSTFMDSVTMMLLVTPVTIRLCEITELSPVPILMCMVFYSNVGAAMTPVGDPPNVIITTNRYITSQGMDFLTFFLHMFPGVMLTIVQTYLQLRYLHYRKLDKLKIAKPLNQEQLKQQMEAWYRAAETIEPISKDESIVQQTLLNKGDDIKSELDRSDSVTASGTPANFNAVLAELRANYYIRDVPLLIKSLVAFGLAAFLFCVHSLEFFHNITLDWAALLCAILLLVIADIKHVNALLRRVEWSTLLFFAALFILMEALAKMGLIEIIGNGVMSLILLAEPNHRLTCAILIILWVSAIASAFLDNIPVATMMVKIVIQLAKNPTLNIPMLPLCWALALGACFGGNGTLIGASANVVAAGVAQQHGYKFTFVGFFLVGFPIMLGNTIMATIYLLLAHTLFSWH